MQNLYFSWRNEGPICAVSGQKAMLVAGRFFVAKAKQDVQTNAYENRIHDI
jgi:hypothetical protein